MAQFKYKGKRMSGEVVHGTMDASTHAECYERLKDDNIYAYSVEVIEDKVHRTYRMKALELSEFARQISTMQASGIPLIRGIEIIRDRVTKPQLIQVYTQLYTYISNGNSLSDGMIHAGGTFPDIMINMFKAGEANGRLDHAAMKMATYYEGEHRIGIKIRNATVYPTILASLTVAVTILIFTFIMPQFFDLIEGAGNELNIATKAILGISKVLVNQWYVVILVVLALIALGIYLVKRYAVQVDKMKLYIPKFRQLLVILYTSRFARTLSSMYSSGVPMLDAVELSSKTIGNKHIEGEFVQVVQKIRNGETLSEAITDTEGIEKKLVSAVYVGEETGQLDTMLTAVAQEYEFEAGMAIERMLAFLEPILLIIMGLVIGTVMISVFVPLMQMYSSVG